MRTLVCAFLLQLVPELALAQILRPNVSTHTNGGFSSPGNAIDTNLNTSAGLSFGRTCSEGAGTTTKGTTWQGVLSGFYPTGLFVKWSTNGNAGFAGLTTKSKLEYSTDGGSQWSAFPSMSFQAPPTFSLGVTSVSVSLSGVPSQNIQVRVIPELTSTGACMFGSSAVVANVYDIHTETCGGTPDIMISEYIDFVVNWIPTCQDFASSGGSTHFSWSALNGGFTNGNPHQPWGIIKQGLTDSLEQTRTNYNRGEIQLNGAYRCPHGNNAVGGAAQSKHMYGVAADMQSQDHSWTEQEFALLKAAADLTGPSESLSWSTYPSDHHYHAAW
jgi:hypothetical protein